jgi:hypothetical protein
MANPSRSATQAARLERRRAALDRRASMSPAGPAPGHLRVATWNLNSLRARLEAVGRFLERAAPVVVCLQETKTAQLSELAVSTFKRHGYAIAHVGGRAYNGVAVLARHPMADIRASGADVTVADEDRIHRILVSPTGRWIFAARKREFDPQDGEPPSATAQDQRLCTRTPGPSRRSVTANLRAGARNHGGRGATAASGRTTCDGHRSTAVIRSTRPAGRHRRRIGGSVRRGPAVQNTSVTSHDGGCDIEIERPNVAAIEVNPDGRKSLVLATPATVRVPNVE